MLERFTNSAIELLMRAKFEARKITETSAGTDAVVVAMLVQEKALPFKCLSEAGITLQKAQELAKAPDLPPEEDLLLTGFSSLVRDLIELSIPEADQLAHQYVNTEHVLLAILKMEKGRGFTLIERSGIDINVLKSNLLAAIKEKDSTDFHPEPVTHSDTVSMQLFSENVEFFHSFSQTSVKIITQAQSEARNLNCRFAGSEFLLLSLIKEENSIAAKVLRNLNIQLDATRKVVESLLQKIEVNEFILEIPLTSRAKNILKISAKEATQLGSQFIEPEHILLAIEREGRKHGEKLYAGKAYTVLKKLGVEKEIRTLTLKELDKS